jgi:hypothetical protein
MLICATSVLAQTFVERPRLSGAKRDPFMLTLPTVSRKPAPAPVVVTPPPSPPVAQTLPRAPELDLYYAGQMTTPSGERRVFALQQNQLLQLSVGMTLPNGYQVDSIESQVVNLTYLSLGHKAQLPLPARPQFETR